LAAKAKCLKAKKVLEEEFATCAAQLREAERATEEIEEKITQSVEKHKNVMKQLYLTILQRGISADYT
jgi:hypothetical protein